METNVTLKIEVELLREARVPESVLQALDIELRYKTSFWHALILQAAESSGASILYSEDLATGQRCRTIRVINPLIASLGS